MVQDQKFVASPDGQARPEVRLHADDITALTVGASAGDMVFGQLALAVTAKSVFSANAARHFAEVKNTDASILIYLGKDNNVTTANGFPLKPGEAFDFEKYTGPIFAIAASGTPTLAYITW